MKRRNYARHAVVWNLGGPDRSDEVEFYSILAKKYGNKVISLMCATGEIAYGMARQGLQVTAIDIEPEMIAEAKRQHPDNKNTCFLTGDVTAFSLPYKDYDFVFIGTGDFHHLLSEKEMLSALNCIYNVLRDKGCLVLELIYPGDESRLLPERRFDPPNPSNAGINTWKLGETHYNADTLRLNIKQQIFIEKRGKVESFPHELEMQFISRKTLVKLLVKAGFKMVGEYGGFKFEPWSTRSSKWIIETVKFVKT